MLKLPTSWSLEQLQKAELGRTALLVTPSVREMAIEALKIDPVTHIDQLPGDLDTLIAIGGGTLLDQAKVWRASHSPDTQLIAIASLWGSGAEVSPVAVLDHQGAKEIKLGDELVPDVRCLWPELAIGIPEDVARQACGDAWSHALEGFLSPLADDQLQAELAEVIREMTALPLANDPRWFELSALACAGQATAGVGLVHGIAHSLEKYLKAELPAANWGHAKLCSLFLWPVIEFNRQHSAKWDRLTEQYQLDAAAILAVLKDLHQPDLYQGVLELLDQHWMEIIRDPCSRTNSALVRPASKAFFLEQAFR